MAKSLRRRTRPHRCNYRQPRPTNVRARTAKWVALADRDKLGAVLSAAPDSDARPHPPGNPQPTLDTRTVFADPVAWSLSVTTGHRACGVFRLSTVGGNGYTSRDNGDQNRWARRSVHATDVQLLALTVGATACAVFLAGYLGAVHHAANRTPCAPLSDGRRW